MGRVSNTVKRRHILKKQYGMTEAAYNEMLIGQGGVCDICKKPETGTSGPYRTPRSMAVDHDHVSGKVRALLCHKCNAALGMLHEDKNVVLALYAYLVKHGA